MEILSVSSFKNATISFHTQTHLENKQMGSSLHKRLIEDMIHVLFEKCDVKLYGYEKQNDRYWGKMYINNLLVIHFFLYIQEKEYHQSIITLQPIINKNHYYFNKIYQNIQTFIQSFEKPSHKILW